MIYNRDENLQQCWSQNEWYGKADCSDISADLLYNPDSIALETLSELKPEWFIYRHPFLMSPDGKVLYGYCLGNGTTLTLPSSILVYDNLVLHEEDRGYRHIVLNDDLEQIINMQNGFGFYVEDYYSGSNEFFLSIDGLLYDSSEEKLLLYPTGRFLAAPRSYAQLPMNTKELGDHCIFTKKMPAALVIPPTVKYIQDKFFCGFDRYCDEASDPASILFASSSILGNTLAYIKELGYLEHVELKFFI